MGKITRLNQKANKRLKEQFENLGVTYCEKCGSTFGLTFAHRHKRIWYRDQPEKLWDMSEVLLLCLKCHQDIEYNKNLTERTFEELLKRRRYNVVL